MKENQLHLVHPDLLNWRFVVCFIAGVTNETQALQHTNVN